MKLLQKIWLHTKAIVKILWVTLILRIVFIIIGAIGNLYMVTKYEPFESDNKTSMPANRFKNKWWDSYFGNEEDGFGDIYYKKEITSDMGFLQKLYIKAFFRTGEETWWTRYFWATFRNPTHNFVKTKGVRNKVIVKTVIHGNENVTDDPYPKNTGVKFQEAWDDQGKYYPMYYICIMWIQLIPFYKPKYDGKPRFGFRLLMGYKNFAINEKLIPYLCDYSVTFVPNLFKKFVKG